MFSKVATATGQGKLVCRRAMGTLGSWSLPEIKNEPYKHYAPGSPERIALRNSVERMLREVPEIPCIVNGKEVRTGHIREQIMPSDKSHVLCRWHEADAATLHAAADACQAAKYAWEALPFESRAAVYLKAADLLATKYRADVCAAVMLGTGKNVWQAEIDVGCEAVDFWRFNTQFAWKIYSEQPHHHSPGVWNRLEYRPLEGFVICISPFNFLAIGSNLHGAPTMMGNTCVWKPAVTTILGSYLLLKVLMEAGLPDGVVNFVPCPGGLLGSELLPRPELAGVHFTGSTDTFATIWRAISQHLRPYWAYPRVVGETGGKNFHFIHESADPGNVVNNTIRGAFEYQGQKCSATSRMYVPSTLWPQVKEQLIETVKAIKLGCVTDFSIFMSAVIDKKAYDAIVQYIETARKLPDCEIIAGGKYDDSKGFFIEPTIIVTKDPRSVTMEEEIFGPVLTIYVYEPKDFEETLQLCDDTSKYGLTGAIFARDRLAIEAASKALRYAAGNFYINDKCTGAVVAQQPFGGGRGSGTNDKSGSAINLMRWVSTKAVKESFLPLTDFRYPHMADSK